MREQFRPNRRVPGTVVGTAWALWRELDVASSRWSPHPGRSPDWIFRGQADATWPLLPSAWRAKGEQAEVIGRVRSRLELERPHLISDPVKLQLRAEMELVKEFVEVAERDGYPLPPDRPEPGGLPRRTDEVVTLAQHFGVPTCQLDFSRDPRVAMFWALHGNADAPNASLAVWALRVEDCRLVSFLNHARSRNPHLLAQDGVAIVIPMEDHFLRSEGRLPSLEEFGGIPDGALVKFELPCAERDELRRLLEVSGVAWSRMTPGYAGAARTVIARYERGWSASIRAPADSRRRSRPTRSGPCRPGPSVPPPSPPPP